MNQKTKDRLTNLIGSAVIATLTVILGFSLNAQREDSIDIDKKFELKADKLELRSFESEISLELESKVDLETFVQHEKVDEAYRVGVQNQLNEIQGDTRDIKRLLMQQNN
jgi:hypothetical protein